MEKSQFSMCQDELFSTTREFQNQFWYFECVLEHHQSSSNYKGSINMLFWLWWIWKRKIGFNHVLQEAFVTGCQFARASNGAPLPLFCQNLRRREGTLVGPVSIAPAGTMIHTLPSQKQANHIFPPLPAPKICVPLNQSRDIINSVIKNLRLHENLLPNLDFLIQINETCNLYSLESSITPTSHKVQCTLRSTRDYLNANQLTSLWY